jgi:hypothetical protein
MNEWNVLAGWATLICLLPGVGCAGWFHPEKRLRENRSNNGHIADFNQFLAVKHAFSLN